MGLGSSASYAESLEASSWERWAVGRCPHGGEHRWVGCCTPASAAPLGSQRTSMHGSTNAMKGRWLTLT
eukprot:4329419-Amphidinium_carterae.1